MANYNTLKQDMEAVIKTNGKEEITGQILQDILNAMITKLGKGYQFLGVATSETEPVSGDERTFYIAGPGTYPNFDNATIAQGAVGFFLYDEQWSALIFNVVQFVNDVISGGIDKALTAEQGKVLAESIVAMGSAFERALEQAINSLTRAINDGDNALQTALTQTRNELEAEIQQTKTTLRTEIQQVNTTLSGQITEVGNRVTTIEGKIPVEASTENKLADKNYVMDSIREWAADFKGTYDSLEELEAVTADKNDYGYVVRTDAAGNSIYDRYIYTGSAWEYQYSVSSPVFSASEWAAIRSGITSALVDKLTALPDNVTLQQALTAITNRFADYTKTVDLAAIATSGRLSDAIQDADHRTVTDVEKADWNDKAEKAGNYPLMAAGSAKVIEGTTPVAGEYTFRPSGGGASRFALAMIDKIKGKSLVWNQQIDDPNCAVLSRWAAYVGINLTSQDGYGQATLSAENSSFRSQINGSNSVYSDQLIAGHIYLFSIELQLVSGAANGVLGQMNAAVNLRANYTTGIVALSQSWTRLALITPSYVSTAGYFACAIGLTKAAESGDAVVNFRNYQFVDLTQMFGAGHEPSTVAEFEALYNLPYYAHNPGQIINNKATAIETVGFNQWDEEWEVGSIDTTTGGNISNDSRSRSKNYIPIFPNANYYFKKVTGALTYIFYYDANMNYTGYRDPFSTAGSGGTFTTLEGAYYMRFIWAGTTYNHDICINRSNATRNGEYEPYQRFVLNLDLTTQTGKLNGEGESVTICPDGMRGVDGVYDEGKISNGYFNEIVNRFGKITLTGAASEDYADTASNENGLTYFRLVISDRLASAFAKVICNRFVQDTTLFANATQEGFYLANNEYVYIRIKTSTASTVEQFRTWLAANPLDFIYELATPEVYVLDKPVFVGYLVSKDGTERRLPEDTASVVNAPFACDVIYPIDINDYLSKAQYEASQKDMLEAQKSTGLISAYTIAWDESQQKFVYTITV